MAADTPPVPSDTATRLTGAARVRAGAAHYTAIVASYETRQIIVASGLQFRPEDARTMMQKDGLTHESLKRRYGLIALLEGLEVWVKGFNVTSDSTGEYLSRKQGVRFLVRLVDTKPAFKAALETPGAHVIYHGHARYGRGPCFGPPGAPKGDWWEQGDTETGIFRMGYPFIGVPLNEIHEHGYHARLAMAADGVPDADDCEPELAPYRKRFVATAVGELDPDVAALLIDDDGNPLGADAEVWAYRRPDRGASNVRFVVLKAGWENTASAPADLGATDMQCRVFCHFGCDSYIHNHAIVRTRKGWRRHNVDEYGYTVDVGFAYFTSAVAHDTAIGFWLTGWMTYDQPCFLGKWDESLQYALRYTNAQLAALGETWRIL